MKIAILFMLSSLSVFAYKVQTYQTSDLAHDLVIYACDVSPKAAPQNIIATALLSNQTGELTLSTSNKLEKNKALVFKYQLDQLQDMPKNIYLLDGKVEVQLRDSDAQVLMTAEKAINPNLEVTLIKYSKFINITGKFPMLSTEEVQLKCENQLRHQVCAQMGCF